MGEGRLRITEDVHGGGAGEATSDEASQIWFDFIILIIIWEVYSCRTKKPEGLSSI